MSTKNYQRGAMVQVNIQTDGAQIKCPTAQFNGQVFKIERRHQPKPTVKPQFTLEGCKSEYGLPFWFMEDDLILL